MIDLTTIRLAYPTCSLAVQQCEEANLGCGLFMDALDVAQQTGDLAQLHEHTLGLASGCRGCCSCPMRRDSDLTIPQMRTPEFRDYLLAKIGAM